jgi:hypothetical protein
MTGSLLELLEVGGPEAVREQLAGLPPAQRKDIVRAVSASGYPGAGNARGVPNPRRRADPARAGPAACRPGHRRAAFRS